MRLFLCKFVSLCWILLIKAAELINSSLTDPLADTERV